MTKYNYGDLVCDKITGVVGVVTAYAHYYGKENDAYCVEYKNATGTFCRDWISVNRLVKVESED